MLNHEAIRDDVRIRAESLAYLMIFSLLPLIAGGFFIFTVLAQFGFVQEALQSLVDGFLSTIPTEHREFLADYILKFKDSYLKSMTEKSGTFGIFALLILVWVGLSTFTNIEKTLNSIWSSERSRSFFVRARNFLVVSVAAPVALTAALSIPLILRKISVTNYLLNTVPLLPAFLSHVIPLSIILGIFTLMYLYVPVQKVYLRSAVVGALFSTFLLELVNVGMRIYFTYGTNTAYGKAAIVPLIGFWLFLIWLVVILGAEVSFLVQNEKEFTIPTLNNYNLNQVEGLFSILSLLQKAYQEASGPVSFQVFKNYTGLNSDDTKEMVSFLVKNRFIVESAGNELSDSTYVLARDLKGVLLTDVLTQLFAVQEKKKSSPFEEWFIDSLKELKGKTVSDWLLLSNTRS
jgi:membrane protein